MRAIVCTDYGPPDVLQLRDVVKPVPKDNEVLVRIRATTVSAADCELRRFDFAPLDLGAHAAGVRHPPTKTTRARAGACRRHRVGRQRCQVVQEGRPGLRGDGHRVGSLRGVHLPAREPRGRGDRDDAGEPELRGGCGRTLRGRRGLAVPAEGERPERTEGPGQRGGRELRHVRGPTRQDPRGSRDRGG